MSNSDAIFFKESDYNSIVSLVWERFQEGGAIQRAVNTTDVVHGSTMLDVIGKDQHLFEIIHREGVAQFNLVTSFRDAQMRTQLYFMYLFCQNNILEFYADKIKVYAESKILQRTRLLLDCEVEYNLFGFGEAMQSADNLLPMEQYSGREPNDLLQLCTNTDTSQKSITCLY